LEAKHVVCETGGDESVRIADMNRQSQSHRIDLEAMISGNGLIK
jgi:hypothetical protein